MSRYLVAYSVLKFSIDIVYTVSPHPSWIPGCFRLSTYIYSYTYYSQLRDPWKTLLTSSAERSQFPLRSIHDNINSDWACARGALWRGVEINRGGKKRRVWVLFEVVRYLLDKMRKERPKWLEKVYLRALWVCALGLLGRPASRLEAQPHVRERVSNLVMATAHALKRSLEFWLKRKFVCKRCS